jgi:hypothetical protein
MTQIKNLPEDVFITLISEHLPKETPILMMVDKFLYQVIHSYTTLKIIHYNNYKNNNHWVNILTNHPQLINWVFFESKLPIQIKSSTCPSFIAPFVTHPNCEKLLSRFNKLHPDVLFSLISNNLDHLAKSFVQSSEIELAKIVMNLCQPKEISVTVFAQCLSLYHQSSIDVSYLINLIQTFSAQLNHRFIESLIIENPPSFLNQRTNSELLNLLSNICGHKFWFVIYYVVKYIPHLIKEVPQKSIKYSTRDTYYITRLLSIDSFVNDFSLVLYVMNGFPFSYLDEISHQLWPLLISHCSNIEVLNYFLQKLPPSAQKLNFSSIKSLETFWFLKTRKLRYQSLSTATCDLRLMIFFQSNLFGHDESKLANICVTALKNNYFHPSLSKLLITKSSAKKIVNYLDGVSYSNILAVLEKIHILFSGNENQFQFFHKLLLRSAIMAESIVVIYYALLYFNCVDQLDLEFSLKQNKTASALLIQHLLN